jgi:hypothetical protein
MFVQFGSKHFDGVVFAHEFGLGLAEGMFEVLCLFEQLSVAGRCGQREGQFRLKLFCFHGCNG